MKNPLLTKKYFLLLSFVGFSEATIAQSSVSLFGIVDQTVAHGKGSIASKTQLLRGGLNSNRLGFRGVENLGSGFSAGFWLEAGFNADEGSGQSSNTNNQANGATPAAGLTFNRRSTVSLTSPWGELRLGRDFVPQYHNQIVGDPFANVGVGSSVNYTANISGVTNTRASNAIGYFSPSLFGGFGVQITHYRGENSVNDATKNDGTGSGARLFYNNGPLTLGAGWGRTKYFTGDATQRNVAGSYKFDFAKIMATLNSDTTGVVNARGGVAGISVPVETGELKASYSVYRTNAAGDPKAEKFALGYVHNLSKRTAVYTTFARVNNSGGSSVALNSGTTAPNKSSRGIDLGIRHVF